MFYYSSRKVTKTHTKYLAYTTMSNTQHTTHTYISTHLPIHLYACSLFLKNGRHKLSLRKQRFNCEIFLILFKVKMLKKNHSKFSQVFLLEQSLCIECHQILICKEKNSSKEYFVRCLIVIIPKSIFLLT